MKEFIRNNKWWIIILATFLLVRIFLFATLWFSSPNGWQTLYDQTQGARQVLLANWHEACDWHPPLYYFFTSAFLHFFGSQWFIYLAQLVLIFVSLILGYKILRFFFSENVSLITTLLVAAEPFLAWHNWLLTSENLYMPLFLAGLYYFFRFFVSIRSGRTGDLIYSAVFLALATLTRLNSLAMVPVLGLLLLFLYFIRRLVGLNIFGNISFRRLIAQLFAFNLIFFLILSPWVVRNKMVYGRFVFANVLQTNMYFYNVPTLMMVKQNISQSEACRIVQTQTQAALGDNVGDQGDCSKFSIAELNRQFDFYGSQSRQYIMDNLALYSKIHITRALPFFLQPGYLDLASAYGVRYQKPDITASVLKGNYREVFNYLRDPDGLTFVYLFGLLLWGLCSLAIFFGLIYSLLRDKNKFVFFMVAAVIALYTAFLCSPFVLARYRLPVYIFFFAPPVYLIGRMLDPSRKISNQLR